MHITCYVPELSFCCSGDTFEHKLEQTIFDYLCVHKKEKEREREIERERKIDSGLFGACRFSCRICSCDLLGATDRSLECRRQYRINHVRQAESNAFACVCWQVIVVAVVEVVVVAVVLVVVVVVVIVVAVAVVVVVVVVVVSSSSSSSSGKSWSWHATSASTCREGLTVRPVSDCLTCAGNTAASLTAGITCRCSALLPAAILAAHGHIVDGAAIGATTLETINYDFASMLLFFFLGASICTGIFACGADFGARWRDRWLVYFVFKPVGGQPKPSGRGHAAAANGGETAR